MNRESLMLHFGHGDIGVAVGRIPSSHVPNEILFTISDRPYKIGECIDLLGDRSTNNLLVPCRMVFDSVASLDVVAKALAELRTSMVAPLPVPAAED